MEEKIRRIYQKLLSAFGYQNWWPGETPFEIALGAILTQQTNWLNVEKAIARLKERNLISPYSILALERDKLHELIKPSGFYRVKAERLRNFVEYFITNYDGSFEKMNQVNKNVLRSEMLSVRGLGKETVDSILLYVLGKDIFVVDNYTKRIFFRNELVDKQDYDEIRAMVEKSFKNSKNRVRDYKELHALIVQNGKVYCRKNPICLGCPLNIECAKKGVNNEQSRN